MTQLYNAGTKKDRRGLSAAALTDSRNERLTAIYSVHQAVRPRLAERRRGAEGSVPSPDMMSRTDLVSGTARLTPRTRPCPEREGGPRVAHTRHQGPYPRNDAYRHRESDGHLRTWVGRSAPSSAQGLGIV